MKIEVKRDSYTARTTLGKLYINGVYFCETLEDTVRPYGIKVKGETAIPEGIVYIVKVTYSTRFKRDMISITTDGNYTLSAKGITFKGIRAHGGNTHKNTEGCPLVAKNRLSDDTIQGTMESPLLIKVNEALKRGEDVQWLAVNLPQK